MPEGDTVYRTAANLRAALSGEVLTGCDIRVPAYATLDLSGEKVDDVISRGKHLLVLVGDLAIHSHLKMEGSWHLYTSGGPWQRPAFQARIVLSTPHRVAVGFSLGLLEIVARDRAGLTHLGPDPLGPDWDLDEATRRVAAVPERPIALAMLDQRNLAGLGNVYSNELCFLMGVLPTTPVDQLDDLRALTRRAARLLQANKDRSRRSTTGDLRSGRELWVYGRVLRPCRRCGTPVERGEIGDSAMTTRVTYWCPCCQR